MQSEFLWGNADESVSCAGFAPQSGIFLRIKAGNAAAAVGKDERRCGIHDKEQ